MEPYSKKVNESRLSLNDLIVEEKYYKPDLELCDRYQSYSSELLRLTILGIAAIGFLYEKFYAKDSDFKSIIDACPNIKEYFCLSILLLSASSFLALLHRYLSTDSMSDHIEYLRYTNAYNSEDSTTEDKKKYKPKIDKLYKSRNDSFKKCDNYLKYSAVLLGIGTAILVLAIIKLICP